jgi:hypothetical protein
MKKLAMMVLALIVPVFLLSADADAKKPRWKGKLLVKLEKAGAIQAADREAAQTAFKNLRECRTAVKKGEKPKGSCIQLRIDWKKARLATFEKAKGFEKLGKRLKKMVDRRIKFLTKNIAKMEEKAKAGPPPAPDAPKDAPKDAPPAK